MTILEQIKSALTEMGFKASPEIEVVRGQLAQATTDVVALQETVTARESEISNLKASLEKAQTEVNAKGQEIAALKSELAAEKAKTMEAMAGLGIEASDVPVKHGQENAKTPKSIVDQLNSITDPTERVVFYRKNKAAIDAAYKNPS